PACYAPKQASTCFECTTCAKSSRRCSFGSAHANRPTIRGLRAMDSLLQYLATRSPFDLARDALDLLITYYIFYRVALVLRGTRAIQVVFGRALVFGLYLGSQLLRLTTVLTLLSAVLSS